ncbi:hypothetical protein HanRHA438_Chr14g0672081 [Helianthus annuus]|nr:hypothetical protein HanRHA438_Chr14g0672081 [Helianthus annuus]
MMDIKELRDGSYSGSRAPPVQMISDYMLNNLKSMISYEGAVIIYGIPSDAVFYATVVTNLKNVFEKVYQITLTNDRHCVLVATPGPSMLPTFSSIQDAQGFDATLLKSSIPAFTRKRHHLRKFYIRLQQLYIQLKNPLYIHPHFPPVSNLLAFSV